MSSDSSRKYFRKFVRRWNDGALREKYYFAGDPSAIRKLSMTSHGSARPVIPKDGGSSHTARRLSTISRRDGASRSPPAKARSASLSGTPEPGPLPPPDLIKLPQRVVTINPSVHTTTSNHSGDSHASTAAPLGPGLGPARPAPSERQLAEEASRELLASQAKAERKASRKSAYEKADELVPKGVGKEGKMAEKKATNASNKEMREKDVGGLEVDEGTLMGSSDGGFAAALRARDSAALRRQEKRDIVMADRRAADEERLAGRRKQDSDTMDMLKEMARQRFG